MMNKYLKRYSTLLVNTNMQKKSYRTQLAWLKQQTYKMLSNAENVELELIHRWRQNSYIDGGSENGANPLESNWAVSYKFKC